MSKFVALLRSVNVGGNNRVAMSELRHVVSEMGFLDVRTLLQSGNVVFESAGQSTAELERALESETERRLELKTDFLVRAANPWHSLLAANPFPDEANQDPSHLVVVFSKRPPTPDSVEALQSAIKGRERVRLAGDHVFAVYPDGIGDSKVTISVIERHLGSRGTARNWNTVLKIAQAIS